MATTPLPCLSDPDQTREHLRAVMPRRDLSVPTVLLVGCDRAARPITHLQLVDCPLATPPSECAEMLETLLDRLAGPATDHIAGLCLGLTRPGSEQVQGYDRAWFRGFHRVCHQRGLVGHGVYVVSRAGIRAVHIDDAA